MVEALLRADDETKATLALCYGRDDPDAVATIKDIYRHLELLSVFHGKLVLVNFIPINLALSIATGCFESEEKYGESATVFLSFPASPLFFLSKFSADFEFAMRHELEKEIKILESCGFSMDFLTSLLNKMERRQK